MQYVQAMIYDEKGGLFPGPLFYIRVLSPHHLSAGWNVTSLQGNTCEGSSAKLSGCSVLGQACCNRSTFCES